MALEPATTIEIDQMSKERQHQPPKDMASEPATTIVIDQMSKELQHQPPKDMASEPETEISTNQVAKQADMNAAGMSENAENRIGNIVETMIHNGQNRTEGDDNQVKGCNDQEGEVVGTVNVKQEGREPATIEDGSDDVEDNDQTVESVKQDKVKEVFKCSQCLQEFKTPGGLKRHIAQKHDEEALQKNEEEIEICLKCSKTFKTAAQLLRHMKTHNTSSQKSTPKRNLPRRAASKSAKRFAAGDESGTDSGSGWELDTVEEHVCEHCDESFKSLQALNSHKKTLPCQKQKRNQRKSATKLAKVVAPDGDDCSQSFQCKTCDKVCRTKRGLQTHMARVKNCKKVTNTTTANKLETRKKAAEDRERKHICKMCGKGFFESSHLLEHEKRHGERDVPCPKCDKKFKCEADVRRHQTSHSDSKPYICKTCAKSYKTYSHLLEHELRHGEAKFSCQYCERKFFVEREMLRHEKDHFKTYPCPHCSEEFREQQALKDHIWEHEQAGTTKQFVCTYCNLFFTSDKGVVYHMNNNHRELLKPEERWQFICDVCNRVSATKDGLRYHKRIHQEECIFPCTMCEKFFKSKQHLNEHEKRHGQPTLACPVCNWKFVLESDLRKHRKRHDMKTIPCTVCDKKFTSISGRNNHMKSHSQSSSSFVCTHCKLGFRSLGGFRTHMNRKHYDTLPESERWSVFCDLCDQVFPSEPTLLHHKRVAHEGRYGCQSCNIGFRTEKALKIHEQIHTGVRSHCCTLCGKGFLKAHHLLEHMKRHSEGNHACKLCDKKYVFQRDLRKHIQMMHFSPKLESCPQCDKKFLSQRSLRQHILLHHQTPVEKRHVCEDCNIQFSSSKGFLAHMNNKHREKLPEKYRWKYPCDKCNRMFRSPRALEIHGKVHSEDRPHECSQCDKRFKEARHLQEHELRHGEAQHPCPHCDKKYVFERELEKHIKTHVAGKQFKCTECHKTFAKNSDLEHHLLKHKQAKKDPVDEGKTLQCNHCSLRFGQKKSLDAHMNNKHRDLLDIDDRWPFWCAKCKKAFRTKVAMKKHEPEHLGKRDFKCDVCSKSFKEARHLEEHRLRHEKPTFECRFCDKKYVFERELQKHEKTHSEDKPYKCTKCKQQYTLESALETHMKKHEQTIPKVVCSFCSLGFISNALLQQHLNNQHRDQLQPAEQWTNVCKYCSKAYPTESALQKHEKVHRNLRVFICKVCGKRFKLSHHLMQHEKRHREGELECEYCHKKYVFASDLRKHVRIHTGEKPFTCQYCGKGFRVSGVLRKHLRVHEQTKPAGKPHKCESCKKAFCSKDKLAEHIKTYHEKLFVCNICNKKFCFEKFLQRHIAIHNAVKAYTCQLCGRQFVTEKGLSSHLEKHEKGLIKVKVPKNKYQCRFCVCSYPYQKKLKYHMNTKHYEALDDSEKWKWRCQTCQKIFALQSSLLKHEDTHKANEQDLNPGVTALQNLLQRHEATQNTNEQHNENKVIFALQGSLQSQDTVHKANAQHNDHQVIYQCLLCPQNFQNPQEFAYHERWHREQTQPQQQLQQQLYVHLCKFCSKAFSNGFELRQHESSHTPNGVVTVPLQGDLSYRQDGLVQLSLREAGLESATTQPVPRTDGPNFEFLAELISATSNILT